MIKANIEKVENNIRAACLRAGRKREDITLIAVSKTMPTASILEAAHVGLLEFGENRVQELCEKIEQINLPLSWHMIGHLQRNKVKYIIGKTRLIHSLDSLRLAEQIDLEASKQGVLCDVLLEVNIAHEESKYGLLEEELFIFLKQLSCLSNLRVKGLMTVAPYTKNAEENRIIFRKMRQLSVDIANKNIDNVSMDFLSMGMTGDYEVAIEEGATHVRVGTGIFGSR